MAEMMVEENPELCMDEAVVNRPGIAGDSIC
jgi:hypothetical protein